LNESSGGDRANTVGTHLQMGLLQEEVVVVVVAGAPTLSLLPLPMPSVEISLLGGEWGEARGSGEVIVDLRFTAPKITTYLLPLLHLIRIVKVGGKRGKVLHPVLPNPTN
jgi:hypothetical protein